MKTKKSFWKKLLAFLMLGAGVFTMSACQTTNSSDARIIVPESKVAIFIDEESGERYATVTLAVENNTIFDATEWEIAYQLQHFDGKTEDKKSEKIYMPISHGAKGYVVFTLNEGLETVERIKIIDGSKPVTFRNVWQTYLGWWIACIIILCFSCLFYGIEIFRKGITTSEAMEMFKGKVASSMFTFLFAFIICMFPLIFGAWVPTVILLVTLLASIGAAALFTGIRTLTAK